jgi:hypothetical protein
VLHGPPLFGVQFLEIGHGQPGAMGQGGTQSLIRCSCFVCNTVRVPWPLRLTALRSSGCSTQRYVKQHGPGEGFPARDLIGCTPIFHRREALRTPLTAVDAPKQGAPGATSTPLAQSPPIRLSRTIGGREPTGAQIYSNAPSAPLWLRPGTTPRSACRRPKQATPPLYRLR